jgi:exodeoxyribonuclease V gamma subunit
VFYRYAKATARDYLGAWLAHLVLCACAPPTIQPRTRWFGRFDTMQQHFAFRPVANPNVLLSELLALYQLGQHIPLPFFPNSGWAYLASGLAGAHKAWQGSDFSRGEAEDPYLELALGQSAAMPVPSTVLDPVFEHLAHTVFGPLAEHLDESAIASAQENPA